MGKNCYGLGRSGYEHPSGARPKTEILSQARHIRQIFGEGSFVIRQHFTVVVVQWTMVLISGTMVHHHTCADVQAMVGKQGNCEKTQHNQAQ